MPDRQEHIPACNQRRAWHQRIRRRWALLLLGIAVPLLLAFVARPLLSEADRQTVMDFHARLGPIVGGPNILILCIDAMRPDHTGLYGYVRDTTPQLQQFFRDATVFERAYAPAAITTPSVVGMLSGLYPQNHGVRLLCQKLPETTILVSDHLRRSGYQTAAIVSNAVLSDAASGLACRFDHYDDQVDQAETHRAHMFERKAAGTTDAAIDWLRNTCAADRPHMLYVHYIDPHGPYTPPTECPVDFTHAVPRLIDMTGRGGGIHPEGQVDGLDMVDRYDEEIAYADQEAGRLLRAYQDMGYLDEALVVLCADHGEAMMEHDHWFAHGMFVYEEIIRIPLAIRGKGMPSRRVATAVSLIDVAPTILDATGLPVPADMDGRSLFAPPEVRPLLSEARGNSGISHDNSHNGNLWRCLVRDHCKVTARVGRSGPIREQHLYDLKADPLELEPRPIREGDPLLEALVAFMKRDPDPAGIPRDVAWGDLPGPNVAPTADRRTLDALRSLGYID